MPGKKSDATATRRRFLQTAAGVTGLLVGQNLPPVKSAQNDGAPGRFPAADKRPEVAKLSEHLAVYCGPIHVGIVHDAGKALLIDCGDHTVAGALRGLGITTVEQILFTHHHRDQACGAHVLAAAGARIGVPAAERDYFDNVSAYWKNPASRWHIYNQHPHHLMLAEPVRVDQVLGDAQELGWGPAKIGVLSTPGHTDGSVSYVVDVDGKRTIFCGDAIYDEGQVWDIHSLQKGTQTSDYHGFLGARAQLAKSLGRIKQARPERLVPSHGRIMTGPAKAIDLLLSRLDRCYDKYVAISALRHYFPKLFVEYAERKDHMAIRKGKPPPACLRHFGTTWLLVSKTGAAFAMDCGSPSVVKQLKQLMEKGEIRRVEGLWITHYHDDHVDAVPAFQQGFGDCPCLTDRFVADVISDPLAWRLPCISPSKARVDRVPKDGESWQWHEYRLTAYHFPGQTLYHAGLFVEGEGLRMLFVGDSFTMAGIDDYCAQNRNWLGSGVGFDRCLALIEQLKPTHIFNCHVSEAFDFTPEQCRFMRANLAEREQLYGQIVPWDHANYGMDESWVRCHPYEQSAAAGHTAGFRVVMRNHSTGPRAAACRAVLPRAWAAAQPDCPASDTTTDWASAEVAAKADGQVRLSFPIPAAAKPGRYVIPVDVKYGPWTLPQFTEAIVVVTEM